MLILLSLLILLPVFDKDRHLTNTRERGQQRKNMFALLALVRVRVCVCAWVARCQKQSAGGGGGEEEAEGRREERGEEAGEEGGCRKNSEASFAAGAE